MSHFSVLVIWDDVEGQLAKYSKNLEVEPYVAFTREDKAKERLERIEDVSYREEYRESLKNKSDEEYFNYYAEDYEDKDENGNPLTTSNPNSKWDWYSVGWRWAWELILKPEYKWTRRDPEFSWWWTDEDKKEYLDWLHADSCIMKELDIECMKDMIIYAIVVNWQWYDKWQMWWFGISINENPEWEQVSKEIVAKYCTPETRITVVDCHI